MRSAMKHTGAPVARAFRPHLGDPAGIAHDCRDETISSARTVRRWVISASVPSVAELGASCAVATSNLSRPRTKIRWTERVSIGARGALIRGLTSGNGALPPCGATFRIFSPMVRPKSVCISVML